jgi:hypothetical protein
LASKVAFIAVDSAICVCVYVYLISVWGFLAFFSLSYLISSFSSLISLIKGLMAFWMIIFISSVFNTFNIVDIGVDADTDADISVDLLDLLDLSEIDHVPKNKIELWGLVLNS